MTDSHAANKNITGLGLAALGVVFGDIGTSPLYTLKTVLDLTGEQPSTESILGALSLIIWTLTVVTSIKYVSFAMRIDNRGEGGIMALMSLLGAGRHKRPAIIALGLFGAALIYGDGTITPAISVLSALEGLHIAMPGLEPYILPMAVIILLGLFAIQPQGTAKIGRAFGPIMALWFACMALLGLWGIAQNPGVLWALDPLYAVHYLLNGGITGFLVLGGVFLCVTGAEALYADMGHFGAGPIRLAWSAIVFPSLVLNYAGQAALILSGGSTEGNIFFRLCPPDLLLPLILLSTVATIIASQAVITGAFSMTRQAIQLGWLPRMLITQTSEEGYGQIYVAAVNWTLMIVTVALTVAFRKSDNLAAAYGIAVSGTMLMTTGLLYIAMREIWSWGRLRSGLVAGAFLAVDTVFFVSNAAKFAEGGYVPVLLGLIVYGLMALWHRGSTATLARILENSIPIDTFMEQLKAQNVARVPGTAVFLTKASECTPPIIAWYVSHTRSLHEKVIAITIQTELVPRVDDWHRLTITEVAPNFWRITAFYGFMERPYIQRLVTHLQSRGADVDLLDITYYLGLEIIMPRSDGKGLPRWQELLYSAMQRNAAHAADFFELPHDRVVELGRQISI